MGELLQQLGINWKHLLSQGVNFAIVLVVLTFFVFRPLSRLMEERKKRIDLGLRGAEEIATRIEATEKERVQIVAQAEKSAVEIIGKAEKEGQKRIQDASREGEKKAEAIVRLAEEVAERKRIEDLEKVEAEAKQFIREALIKTVELDPKSIDDRLIEKAIVLTKSNRA